MTRTKINIFIYFSHAISVVSPRVPTILIGYDTLNILQPKNEVQLNLELQNRNSLGSAPPIIAENNP